MEEKVTPDRSRPPFKFRGRDHRFSPNFMKQNDLPFFFPCEWLKKEISTSCSVPSSNLSPPPHSTLTAKLYRTCQTQFFFSPFPPGPALRDPFRRARFFSLIVWDGHFLSFQNNLFSESTSILLSPSSLLTNFL